MVLHWSYFSIGGGGEISTSKMGHTSALSRVFHESKFCGDTNFESGFSLEPWTKQSMCARFHGKWLLSSSQADAFVFLGGTLSYKMRPVRYVACVPGMVPPCSAMNIWISYLFIFLSLFLYNNWWCQHVDLGKGKKNPTTLLFWKGYHI